jgi:8-oxo-dGTP pyrophosphatase MutT (NUDIX family)
VTKAAAAHDARAAVHVAPAATIVLLREADDGRLEALLTRRAAALSFMGGLWVFPGGRMEPDDPSLITTLQTLTPAMESLQRRMFDLDGSPIPSVLAVGLCAAACRETFEECGVLLARSRTSENHVHDPSLKTLSAAGIGGDRDAVRMAAAATGPQGFARLLAAHDLELDLDRLVYWAHWVTPSMEKKRFDTRFFVAQVPPGEEAGVDVDRSELTEHAWLDERAVVTRLRAGELRMAPPTIATLEDVWRCHARHGGLERMLQEERSREVPPIVPKLRHLLDGAIEVVMPWDEEYASLEGEGCVIGERYPAYLATLPSRRRFQF